MTKTWTKPKNKSGASESAREEPEAKGGSEESAGDADRAPAGVSAPTPSEEIEIAGKAYKPGDKFTLGDQEATVVGRKALKASPKAGVSDGTYAIVSMTLQPGNRTAYRALVGETPYPIREYGKPGEVISKIRESTKGERKPRKAASSPSQEVSVSGVSLVGAAEEVLEDYIELSRGGDPRKIVSDLILTHLGPEVDRLRTQQEAISKLPQDMLAGLAGASEETRSQVMALLSKK